MTTAEGPLVRCIHGAASVPGLDPPNDTVHFRLFHPARFSGDDSERMTGQVPPDPTSAPWPLIVWLPGINIGPEGYRWLAIDAARAGYAFVTMAVVADTLPGIIGITPGLDLDAVRPGSYGSRPSGVAIGPLLDAISDRVAGGPLDGLVDMDRIMIGGHSGGGSVALQNANPAWFGGIRSCATFASHTMTATTLGWEPNTVLPMPADVPALLLAGELDGVMARSADRYGTDVGAVGHDPVSRTFDEAVVGGRGDCHLAVVRGAPHTAMIWPRDDTTARGFLDPPAGRDPEAILGDLSAAILAFADMTLRDDPTGRDRLTLLLSDTTGFSGHRTR